VLYGVISLKMKFLTPEAARTSMRRLLYQTTYSVLTLANDEVEQLYVEIGDNSLF
jgi:hypothetical protein